MKQYLVAFYRSFTKKNCSGLIYRKGKYWNKDQTNYFDDWTKDQTKQEYFSHKKQHYSLAF